jgi:hypothetical protein
MKAIIRIAPFSLTHKKNLPILRTAKASSYQSITTKRMEKEVRQ